VSARFPDSATPDASAQPCPQPDDRLEDEVPALVLRMEKHEDHVVVELDGELDIVSGDAFTHQLSRLMDQGAIHFVADLTRLTFCDAAGLSSLLKVRNRLARYGGWLRLASPTPQMSRIISIANLTRTLPSYAAVLDALAGPALAPAR
jgi:anti-anti-sigma factor